MAAELYFLAAIYPLIKLNPCSCDLTRALSLSIYLSLLFPMYIIVIYVFLYVENMKIKPAEHTLTHTHTHIPQSALDYERRISGIVPPISRERNRITSDLLCSEGQKMKRKYEYINTISIIL